MASKCKVDGCDRNVFGAGLCSYHQYMRKLKGGDKYNPKPKKQKASSIPKESKKRKVEHVRYSEQLAMFKEEHKTNGTYYCFITKEAFDDTMDGFCTCHHLRGRTGDYYLDKKYWILARNGDHLDVFHGRKTYEQLCKMIWWEDFLKRLKEYDEESWKKEMKRQEKAMSSSLFQENEED